MIFREAYKLVIRNLTPILFYSSLYLLASVLLLRLGYAGLFLQALLSGPFIAGFYNAYRLDTLGYKPQLKNFFEGFSNPVNFIITHILTGLITAAGIYLLVLPGIYFAVAYFLAIPFLVNRPFGFWQAMEASRLIITRKWGSFALLILILMVMNLLGALLFGIGLLFTIPFTYAAVHTVFFTIFSEKNFEDKDKQETINFDMFR